MKEVTMSVTPGNDGTEFKAYELRINGKVVAKAKTSFVLLSFMRAMEEFAKLAQVPIRKDQSCDTLERYSRL